MRRTTNGRPYRDMLVEGLHKDEKRRLLREQKPTEIIHYSFFTIH